MNERDLLVELHNNFLCNMFHAFQDDSNCYVVMDLCLGGDVRYHLNKNPQIFKEDAIKFYMACNVLALEYLHKSNVLHRDIKPDNMLLDSSGYLKLTDLGISARMVDGKCEKRSGTKPYMAFELLNKIPHGPPSDFYSLAIFMYECFAKSRPYTEASNAQSMKPELLVNKLAASEAAKAFLIKGKGKQIVRLVAFNF